MVNAFGMQSALDYVRLGALAYGFPSNARPSQLNTLPEQTGQPRKPARDFGAVSNSLLRRGACH